MSYDPKFSAAEGSIVGLIIRMPKMKTKLLMTAIAGIATLSATSAIAQIESLREVVYYNFNSAQSAEVEAQMQKITDLANNRGASNIRVTCHTDTTGSAAYNQALSERRAADVLNALVSRGISRNIISSQGLGETSLLVPTGDGVKEQLNRRCEIDLDVQPQFVQQQPVQQEVYREYVPQQTQTQTVEEFVRAPDPTPIEPTTVTRTIQSTPQAITSNVPTQQVVTPRVITPSVPSAPSVPSLPRVPSTGGIFSGGVSPLLAIGGIGAAGAIGAILADGDSNETELAAAEAAAASAQADAAAAAQAQAEAEAAQAEAEAAQAEAEAALEDAVDGDDDAPVSP